LVLARFVRRFLGWRRRRVVVTDQRVLSLSGGLIRRVGSISLEQISEVALAQGPGGRLLGYGTLHVRAGDREITLACLRQAREVWSLVTETSGASGRSDGDRLAGRRTLAPGLPFDQQDTGPLPRVLV
jgi:hypothetical protein